MTEEQALINVDQRVKEAQSLVSNNELTLFWEIENIELTLLRNLESEFLNRPFEIEYLQIDHIFKRVPLFISNIEDDQTMLDLIDLVKNGTRIIPPIVIREYSLIDDKWERLFNDNESGMFLNDGHHRMRLAHAMGLSEIPVLVFDNYSTIKRDPIEFLAEPFVIKESDKMEVYRYNFGDRSPNHPVQKWNYQSKAIRTNNSEGIFGLADGEHCLSEVFELLRENVKGEDKRELVILKLHVDKKKLLYYNAKAICFTECNIIEKLTIAEFIYRVYPNYFFVIEAYRQAMGTSSEEIKDGFISMLFRLSGYHFQIYMSIKPQWTKQNTLIE